MRFPAFARAAVAATLISVFATQPAWGWGEVGHRMINRLAMQNLPADVPAFLRNGAALDAAEWLGPEPDRWRNKAEAELVAEQAPDHFIDLEWADYVGELPRKRYDFIRALAAAQPQHPGIQLTPEKVGMQPYIVEEIWQKLKVDLREYRKAVAANTDTAPLQLAVLYDCGWLGHYVGDGSMPLHTSIQYNGWTGPNSNGYTTEHKIHSLFETVFVNLNVKPADVAPLVAAAPAPQPIADEWMQYLDYLRQTHSLVAKTYQLEKQGAFNGAGTPDGKAMVVEQIAAGSIELRNLIYSAWQHSADPIEEFHGAQ